MMFPEGLPFQFLGQTLILLPQKAIFWQDERALIVADVHFGKVGHFRKSGIAIPKGMEQEDLAALSDLVSEYSPAKIIFLGDLFHSDMNNDWDWFVLWRKVHRNTELVLVRGNHDILSDQFYDDLGFRIYKTLEYGPFLFSHEPLKPKAMELTTAYAISGHIHPGVTLRGKGRQAVTLPCFYFGKQQALLPAFGKFTGRVSMRYSSGEQVFGVLKHKVIAL